MDIHFTCEHCGKHLVVGEEGAGRIVTCPQCRNRVTVPDHSTSPDAKPRLRLKPREDAGYPSPPLAQPEATARHDPPESPLRLHSLSRLLSGRPVTVVACIALVVVLYIMMKGPGDLQNDIDIAEADPLLELRRQADWGDASAMMKVADRLSRMPDDTNAAHDAFRYYLDAAEAGRTEAVSMVTKALAGAWLAETNIALIDDWLTEAAEDGNREAMYQAGLVYSFMDEEHKDMEKAIDWFRRASNAGHEEAMFTMAMFYRDGFHLAVDPAESVRLLAAIDPVKIARAPEVLGIMTLLGEGTTQDIDGGMSLLEVAADQGRAQSASLLGWIYLDGVLVDRDEIQARDWFETSGELGDYGAMATAGLLHRHSGDSGGIKKGTGLIMTALSNDTEAAFGLLVASAYEDALAEMDKTVPMFIGGEYFKFRRVNGTVIGGTVSSLSATGITVLSESKLVSIPFRDLDIDARTRCDPVLRAVAARSHAYEKTYDMISGFSAPGRKVSTPSLEVLMAAAKDGDPEITAMVGTEMMHTYELQGQASEWLRKSAEAGSLQGQYRYGRALLLGEGVESDGERAREFIMKAAVSGHVEAMYLAGMYMVEGNVFPKDEAGGIVLLRSAAEAGHPEAVMRLAKYLYGDGGRPRDAAEAFAWVRVAGIQGDPEGQYWVGRMYFEGKATDVNTDKAYQWLASSASQGFEPAIRFIESDAAVKVQLAQARLDYERELMRHQKSVERARKNPKYDVIGVAGKMPSAFASNAAERREHDRWMAYRKNQNPKASYSTYKASEINRSRSVSSREIDAMIREATADIMHRFRNGTLGSGYGYGSLGYPYSSSYGSSMERTMREGQLEAIQAGE